MVVRKWLWADGFRYRIHAKNLIGKPDIVFRKLKTVIFVNGCYWHGHLVNNLPFTSHNLQSNSLTGSAVFDLQDSKCCKIPHTNREFWVKKISRNMERDLQTYQTYIAAGWQVLVVWECQLRKNPQREQTLRALSLRLNSILLNSFAKQKPKTYKIEEEELGMVGEEPLNAGEDPLILCNK